MRVKFALLTLILLMLGITPPAPGAEVRINKTPLNIGQEKEIEDDLITATESLKISGEIKGDLLALARDINMDGTVNGDMIAGAQKMEVEGEVKDDARLASQELILKGRIGSDLMALAQNLRVEEGSFILGDAFLGGKELDMNGSVEKNLRIWGGEIRIRGKVGGNLHIQGEQISLGPKAVIGGDLVYISPREIEVQEGAKILGKVVWKKRLGKSPLTGGGFRFKGNFLWKLISLTSLISLGSLLIALAPRQMELTAETLISSPGRSILLGLGIFIFAPLILFIIAITMVGLPAAAILLLFYLIILYLSPIFVALAVGRKIFKGGKASKGELIGAMVLGLLIIALLTGIPGIGGIISLIILFFGIGSFAISRRTTYQEAKKKGII